MAILVTGGAGYIGSHTCVSLLKAGHDVVVIDNFGNSYPEVLHRVEKIAGCTLINAPGDIRDREFVETVLKRYRCTSVIHFAGLKAVGESASRPLFYYDCNVVGTLRLLQAMRTAGVKKFIFSSTATVYGTPQYLPYDEKHPLAPESVYGQTKLAVEKMLEALRTADPEWSIAILRYFNPVGAHESGLIGEDPKGIPNNLMPILAQVASGRREKLTIWGNDYETRDGTGVRDYIHVADLADGHMAALKVLETAGCRTFNLGCGTGYSVMEVIRAFEHVSNRAIPYEIGARRPGDIGEFYANPVQAKEQLGWQATKDLRQMCEDMWHFQVKNPDGYNNSEL
ncbi:MAG: UDP-glucose 4-epimerase [Candidatus Tokpelaia hoelldobleri]|uniref:UDP-glucose 4-epimerase n=1 Tax=Candidatus Tokpelaia hoelldobleri TaxID=1902579 RepID=A0A1U9JUX0_9HYPH|nr:MAG: UDP-glucose 4-epimerase [Candidatus Tokpelaia hoelldoblerii]